MPLIPVPFDFAFDFAAVCGADAEKAAMDYLDSAVSRWKASEPLEKRPVALSHQEFIHGMSGAATTAQVFG
jgi:hypothetical protein